MLQKLPIFAAFLTLAACEADIYAPHTPELVVEGWVEAGGFPVVMVTKSFPVTTDKQSKDSLAAHLVKWATVSVSDGDTTVYLTGKYDSGYFPPYIYTTTGLRAREGREYALRVEFGEYLATATTTVPAAPQAGAFRFEPTAADPEAWLATVELDDPPGEKNYYQLFSRVGGETRQVLPAYMGCFDDAALKRPAKLPIYRAHRLGANMEYTPYFLAGDTVAVKVAQVDSVAFAFWRTYGDLVSNSENQFLAPTQGLRGNVHGAQGYSHGMNARTAWSSVPKAEDGATALR